MKIEKINAKENTEIRVVYVEALLMPNGEVLRNGKTIGWDEKDGVYAEVKE